MSQAATGSFFDQNQIAIEERLSKDIQTFLPEHDPIYSKIVAEQGGKGEQMNIGRDMIIRRTFYSGYTGVIEQGNSSNNFVLFGDTAATPASGSVGDKLWMQNLTETWPDPTTGPATSPFQLDIPMRSSLTNLLWTMGEMQAEALPAHIASVIGPKLKGFAQNMAHTTATFLYLSQNNKYQLCALPTGFDITTDNTTLTFEPANLACGRVNVGMRVHIYNAAGTTQRVDGTVVDFLVTAVDRAKNKISLKLVSNAVLTGTTNLDTALAATDILVFPGLNNGGSFVGYAGLNSWIKTGSGSGDDILLEGEAGVKQINVHTHPELKSLGFNFHGAPLTEHRLRQICMRFDAAHGIYGHHIDSLVASEGVWLAYERQNFGKESIDRTHNLSTITKGQGSDNMDPFAGIKFTFNGRSLTGYTSAYVDAGTVYGLKTAEANWKIVTPPDYKGLSKGGVEGVGRYAAFRFVAPAMTGGNSVWMPITKAAAGAAGGISLPTEGTQMPGMIRQQLIPDNPCSIKVTNVEEDRLYADF